MGYPVSYRNGARKYQAGGFQNPVKVPPGTKPPRPANDNWRPPANDNEPGGGRPRVSLPKAPPYPGLPDIPPQLIPPQYRLPYEVVKYPWNYYSNQRTYPDTTDISTQLIHTCGPVFPKIPAYWQGRYAWHLGAGNICGLSGQVMGEGLAVPPVVPPKRGLIYAQRRPDWGIWAIIEQWWNDGDVAVKPTIMQPVTGPTPSIEAPAPMPATVTNPMPAIVPAPVGNVVPAARPMPATVPDARPAANVYTRPQSNVRPDHWPKPGPHPGPVVVVGPGQATNPVRKPPGPGVKERKVRASGAIAGALGIAAGVYEDAKFYNDVLNAWYDALPGKKSAKTPAEKALELYRRADEIDVQKAIINVLIAVAGEKAGGYIERARRKAGDNLGLNMYISIPTGSAPRV